MFLIQGFFQGQPLKILKFQGNFKGVVFNDFVLPSCSQTSIWEFQELSQDSLSVLDINLSRIFVSNLQSCKRLPLGILFITGPDFTNFRSFEHSVWPKLWTAYLIDMKGACRCKNLNIFECKIPIRRCAC